MKRQIRASEVMLLIGLSLIFIFMLIHDWVPLGQLNDVQAIAAAKGKGELIAVTLFNAGQILLLIALVIWFMGKTYPIWAKLWLIIHQGCILAGAFLAWWIPYLFGIGAEEKIDQYDKMFGNTHVFLPVNNGIVPNTIHVLFHATLLICLLLAIHISFTRSGRQKT